MAIPGYNYGSAEIGPSPVSSADLAQLEVTVGLDAEDRRYLELAADVLGDQLAAVVMQWRRDIIGSIPNLSRHSRSPQGELLLQYVEASNLRFEQWILDTCTRPYDQDWLNYQHEIARRHMTARKNLTDHVSSTRYVPFRDCMAFVAVMNETIKPYLAAKGHSSEKVERMHRAWCKSMQLQMALWAKAYADAAGVEDQW